jgi:hypothetical protein
MSRPHGPAVAEPELERLLWETELEQLRSAHADSASTASARFAELNREADDAAAAYIRKLDEAQAQLGETDAALSALCAARAEVVASQAERISVLEAQVANLRLSARAAGAGQQTTLLGGMLPALTAHARGCELERPRRRRPWRRHGARVWAPPGARRRARAPGLSRAAARGAP